MDSTRAAPQRPPGELPPAQIAKAALRRLAVDKLEPTPDNYRRAYLQESGGSTPPALPAPVLPLIETLVARALADAPAPVQAELNGALAKGRWEQAAQLLERQKTAQVDASALAGLIERIVRGVERGGRQWTAARKKDGLQRVLSSSRSDAQRLQQRLSQLVASWESDTVAAPEAADDADSAPPAAVEPVAQAGGIGPVDGPAAAGSEWPRLVASLGGTVRLALPPPPEPNAELGDELIGLTGQVTPQGPEPAQADEIERLCQRVGRVLQHRHHLVDQLGGLCRELTASLAELAEDDSWARGQCEAMRLQIEDGLTARSVRSVSELLGDTRERQKQLRVERARARDSLKILITRMLSELGELGSQTGRFHDSLGRYADVIEKADSVESLAGVVREMVEESRTVQMLVGQAQVRLQSEHDRATGLSEKVHQLEDELRRLSEEVSTDQLTQIANRRGLLQAFDAERARLERTGAELCVGLLDVDNFKRLNDELGHSAGDQALKALADVVSRTLRPTDRVARYGGEEFVVLLPETPVAEGEQILTRLQRSLSGGLFMHEERQIFVTFSAGVTAYRTGERLEAAIERADEALYEAKRTGKNRTCIS